MKKQRHMEEQITFVLRQVELGAPVPEDRGYGADPPPLEEQICRHAAQRHAAAEAAGRGKRQTLKSWWRI